MNERIIPQANSTQQWEQNEASIMRKLLNESKEAQLAADEKLTAELAPIAALPPWEEWWNSNESVRNNPIARINAFQMDSHKEFLKEEHKHCTNDCKYVASLSK